jgi:hypothetical protein
LLWYTLLEENDNRSMSDTYPMIQAFQTIYLNHINTWRASSTFTILSYQQMFRTYRNTYKDYETDIESYSSFIHIDRFITHQVGINQKLDTFF